MITAETTKTAINENSLADAIVLTDCEIDDRLTMLSLSSQPEVDD